MTLTSTKKAFRFLGTIGIMMAMAGMLAINVRPATASGIVPTPTFGKVSVWAMLDYSSPNIVRADISIWNSKDIVVAKGTVTSAPGSSYTTTLAAGVYKICVSAAGHKEFSTVVKVAAGQTTIVKALLDVVPAPIPVPIQMGKLVVNVEYAPSPNPILMPQATLVVTDGNNNPVAKGVAEGGMFSAELTPGRYKVEVTATGYIGYNEIIKIAADETTNVKVYLMPR